MLDNEQESRNGRHNELGKRARIVGGLAHILFEYYQCKGPVDLLGTTAQLYCAYRDLTIIIDTSNVPKAFVCIGNTSFAIFELYHDLTALEESIRLYEKALTHPHIDFVSCCDAEIRLAYALLYRWENYSSWDDHSRAVDILKTTRTRAEHEGETSSEAWALIVMGLVSCRKVTIARPKTEDLQEILRQLQHILPKASLPAYPYLLSFLVEIELHRAIFVSAGIPDHLHEGLRRAECVMKSQLYSEMSPVVVRSFEDAVFDLYLRACKSKNTDRALYLKLALEFADRRIESTGIMTYNPDAHRAQLHSWALVQLEQSIISDDINGIEAAINKLEEVIGFYPSSHLVSPYLRNQYIYMLTEHFFRFGRISVLDRAIDLRHTYAGHLLETPFLAMNIAECMLMRAQLAERRTAKSLIVQALSLCKGRRESPGFANATTTENRAVEYIEVSASAMQLRMGDEPYLDTTSLIELSRRSLAAVDPEHIPGRIMLILAQIDSLISRARTRQDTASLTAAEEVLEKEISYGHIMQTIYQVDIYAAQGDLLVARWDIQGHEGQFLVDAWACYRQAAAASDERAKERFHACLRWAANATQHAHFSQAFEAYSCAIDLLPKIVFLGEEVLGRIEALRQVNGLATASVAVALTIGDITSAMELLERTRSILWQQSLPSRSSQLAMLPSTMRKELLGITRSLEMADRVQWTTRRKKTEELEKLLTKIRDLPDLERFALPSSLHEIDETLKNSHGFAVIVVPSALHCDVILLGLTEGPAHLRFDLLGADRFRDLSKTYDTACSSTREVTRNARKLQPVLRQTLKTADPTTELLAELWNVLVHPIIIRLGLEEQPDSQTRKRVWWCPIGASSSLPLHAAGLYERAADKHVSRYLVSSYTPTLTALHRLLSEKDSVGMRAEPPNVLLVSQSESDIMELPSLPSAKEEIELVRRLLPPGSVPDTWEFEGVSVDMALDAAEHADVIHLACHGHQNQDNPLNSGFSLRDGRLTLGQLMRLNAPRAQMAYLSACESAGLDESRPDEGLNLVGAMIFVGFKSVIGTLWAMDDIDGPFMAQRIYSRILEGGVLNLDAVPYAVDAAVQELRETGVPASRWATYVHFGV